MTSAPVAPPTRRLLGIRRKPGRLALAVFRLPLRAYRHNAGHVFGHTFLLLVHIGRRTGKPHEMVAMVLRYDPVSREAVILSGWGPHVDWVRNLEAGPAARVQIGRVSYRPEHRFLTPEESFEVAVRFRREHPWRVRLASRILGWGDLGDDDVLRAFVRSHPFVALRPMSG